MGEIGRWEGVVLLSFVFRFDDCDGIYLYNCCCNWIEQLTTYFTSRIDFNLLRMECVKLINYLHQLARLQDLLAREFSVHLRTSYTFSRLGLDAGRNQFIY